MKKAVINNIEFIYDEKRDYIDEEGKLRCKKCNQIVCLNYKLLGKEKIIRKKCKCKNEYDKFHENIKNQEIELNKIRTLKNECFGKNRYINSKLELNRYLAEEYYSFANLYVHRYGEIKKNNKGLYIYGDVGTGKTYYASSIINLIIEKYKESAKFINFTNMIDAYTNFNDYTERYEYEKYLSDVPILLIDDFDVIRLTSPFMIDLAYKIINKRYETELLTIFTSNITFNRLKNETNSDKKKIYSRIIQNTVPIKFYGQDLRVEISEIKKNEFINN